VSIAFNRQRLKQTGVEPGILELFGNISYAGNIDMANTSTIPLHDNQLLYFGGAPRGAYLDLVVKGINDFCEDTGKPIHIILICPESENKQVFIRRLKETFAIYKGTVTDYGFVEPHLLSSIMTHCTAGIARSEPYLLGKSGTAIAMLEHGLPIWLPKWNRSKKLDFSFRRELIHSNLVEAMSAQHEEYLSQLPFIAKQFISELNKHQ